MAKCNASVALKSTARGGGPGRPDGHRSGRIANQQHFPPIACKFLVRANQGLPSLMNSQALCSDVIYLIIDLISFSKTWTYALCETN